MGDIFKNKFFIIFLIAVCVLTIATMGLTIAGYGNLISDAANIILEPFQIFANIIKNSVSGFTDYFTKFNELKAENADLKERVRILELENEDAQAILKENESLMAFMDLKKEHLDFKLQNASVILGSASNYSGGFTVNKGAFHGVKKDMAVVASEGVLGYISEVGTRTSKVSPFIRTSNSIGAYIKRTRETGIVEGDFELEKRGLCRLSYLSRESDIQVGDKIYSSGYGGTYPEGLFIGTIAEVYSDPLTQTPAAYIEPAVNFNKVRDVMIILDFNWVFN